MGYSAKQIQDFYYAAAFGDIPGFSDTILSGTNPSIGPTDETLWDAGGTYVFPSSPDTVEIVSDEPNDNIAGTGARIVVIDGLNELGLRITETIFMNGTTPVTTINNFLFIQNIFAPIAGASLRNEGTIAATHTTSGGLLSTILPLIGASQNSMMLVPADKQAVLVNVWVTSAKGARVFPKFQFTLPGTNGIVTSLFTDIYQTAFAFPDFRSGRTFDPLTRIAPVASTETGTSRGSVGLHYIFKDL